MQDSNNDKSELKITDKAKATPSSLEKKVLSVSFSKKLEGIAKRDREEPFSIASAALKKRKLEPRSNEGNERLDSLLNECEKEIKADLSSKTRLGQSKKEIDASKSEGEKPSFHYKFVTPQGDVYEGGVKKKLALGQGVLTFSKSDSSFYPGPFEDQFHDGLASYRGEQKKGKAEGYGRLQFKNGDFYEGQFEAGEFCGKGSFTYKNGTVFTGEFTHGRASGSGKFTFPNGDTYEAKFIKGKLAERGILTFKNGSTYTGQFPGLHHIELVDSFSFTIPKQPEESVFGKKAPQNFRLRASNHCRRQSASESLKF